MDRNVRESVVWISVDDHSRSHAVLEFANVPYDSFTVPDDHRRRSEEHTSELQSRLHLVCRLLLEKKTTVDKGDVARIETEQSETEQAEAVQADGDMPCEAAASDPWPQVRSRPDPVQGRPGREVRG